MASDVKSLRYSAAPQIHARVGVQHGEVVRVRVAALRHVKLLQNGSDWNIASTEPSASVRIRSVPSQSRC
jgi:hypothetical protein